MRLSFMLAALFFAIQAHAASFTFDQDSGTVGFEIIKFKIGSKVAGSFKKFSGTAELDEKKNELFVFSDGFNLRIRLMAEKQVADKSGGNKIVTSTLPVKIINLLVEAQQEVQEGEVLMVQEAMKMEHSLVAGISGKVSQLYVKEGDVVSADQLLVEIE